MPALRRAKYEVAEGKEPAEISAMCRTSQCRLLITEFNDFIRRELEIGHDDPCASVPRIYISSPKQKLVPTAEMPHTLGWLSEPSTAKQIVLSVAVALQIASRVEELIDRTNHLQRAVAERREISIAMGVIMERFRVDQAQAFDMVRHKARSTRRKIHAIAVELIAAIQTLSIDSHTDSVGNSRSGTRARRIG